jgi:phosphoglycolate phosphatase
LQVLKRQGRLLAVISNKNVSLCRKVLHTLQVEDFFTSVLGADSTRSRKPSPEPVLKLLGENSVPPSKAVIIGDSINDISAGKASGIITVGCTYGYGKPDELKDADYLVGTITGLLGLPIFR